MPIVQVLLTKKLTAEEKSEFMEFVAQVICKNTSTLSKNIYVYIQEFNPDNARKSAPIVMINWTMMPDRTESVKNEIVKEITNKLAKIEPELKDEIVILINDIPLTNTMLGGETRLENPDNENI